MDGWPDDIIEARAWVEVTPGVDTPEKAVVFIERHFPLEDRDPAEIYTCDGERAWMMPDPRAYDPVEGPWIELDTDDVPSAREFWVIKVLCEGVV